MPFLKNTGVIYRNKVYLSTTNKTITSSKSSHNHTRTSYKPFHWNNDHSNAEVCAMKCSVAIRGCTDWAWVASKTRSSFEYQQLSIATQVESQQSIRCQCSSSYVGNCTRVEFAQDLNKLPHSIFDWFYEWHAKNQPDMNSLGSSNIIFLISAASNSKSLLKASNNL